MKPQKTIRHGHNIVKRFLAGAFLVLFAATWIVAMLIPETADPTTKLSPLIPLLIPVAIYYFKED